MFEIPPTLPLIVLAWLRSAALVVTLPVFTGRSIPAVVRLALAGFLALMVPVDGSVPIPGTVGGLVWIAGQNVITGLMMSFSVAVVFGVINAAGQLIANELGLMMASTFDPTTQVQNTAVGSTFNILGMVLFFITGADRLVLAAYVRSFDFVPLTQSAPMLQGAGHVVRDCGQIFVIAIQMAAPIMAVNFIVNLAFSILGKTVPRLNVFVASMSVRTLAGMVLLTSSLGLIVQIILSLHAELPERMLRVLTP